MARLQDKVALITGGESGIGLATARLFIAEGARVHLVGIDEPKLASAVEELGADNALASVADVTDEDAVMRAVAEGAIASGALTSFSATPASAATSRAITDYPSDVFAAHAGRACPRRLPRPQAHGPAHHRRRQHHHHLERRRPDRLRRSSAYVAAKHGQVGLMRSAAKELAPRRIRVNTLHPGPTSTAFQDDIEMRATGKPREEAAKDFDELVPLGRHTTPEEIAQAALPGVGRERDGHVAHVLDRRRPERVTRPATFQIVAAAIPMEDKRLSKRPRERSKESSKRTSFSDGCDQIGCRVRAASTACGT